MLRRRQINGDRDGRVKRFVFAIADALRWPFERVFWTVEERAVWPLRERAAGWVPSGRATAIGSVAAGGLAALLLAALLLPGGGTDPRSEGEPVRVALTPPATQQSEQPAKRALQGPPPRFGVAGGASVAGEEAEADSAAAGASTAPGDGEDSGSEAGASTATGAEAGASASLRKPVPAGPAAMKVARRFSKAFLNYEIGRNREAAKGVFAATATPQLAKALAERPPRLPESDEVPKARIVNIVPGPRAGKAYSVSVSLLRVGLTSELRLELLKQGKGKWVVTDVRG